MASAPRYIPAISSMSLGRAWNHDIAPKLAACGRHGYKAIELFYEDLEYVARSLPQSFPSSPAGTSFSNSTQWEEQQLAAASYIRHLCNLNHLNILCLQPFMHYEGLIDRAEHDKRIQKLQLWFRVAKILNTDLIQIPSAFLPSSQCTGDRSIIVSDLQKVADLGAAQSPPIRFAYEALCWGTHVDHWDQAYEIVEAINRPNFGTCIDTFNFVGRIYGDPTSPSGKTATAEADMVATLAKLRAVDVSKIFYVEVVDAERLSSPLVEGHPWYKPEQAPRMSWSRNARLFPFERLGYLPILDVLRVITEELGYTGYISFELFNRSMNEAGASVPEDHASRGMRSWRRLRQVMSWNNKAEENDNRPETDGDCSEAEVKVHLKRKPSIASGGSNEATAAQIQLAMSKL